jgi:ferredoxin
MQISILNSCVGCGACAIINPEVFEIVNSQAIINKEKISNSEELCIDAAIYCPINAIEILDY